MYNLNHEVITRDVAEQRVLELADELQELAQALDLPIHLNHSFLRVAYDIAYGQKWQGRVQSPVFHNASLPALLRALEILTWMVESPEELVPRYNSISLMLRGKSDSNAHADMLRNKDTLYDSAALRAQEQRSHTPPTETTSPESASPSDAPSLLRLALLTVRELIRRGYGQVRLHSYIKGGLGALRVGYCRQPPGAPPPRSSRTPGVERFFFTSFGGFDYVDDWGNPLSEAKKHGLGLEEVADSFVERYAGALSRARGEAPEAYVAWLDDVIEATAPDGFPITDPEMGGACHAVFPSGFDETVPCPPLV